MPDGNVILKVYVTPGMILWKVGETDAYSHGLIINTLGLRQNGRQYPDDYFKCIFLNENI